MSARAAASSASGGDAEGGAQLGELGRGLGEGARPRARPVGVHDDGAYPPLRPRPSEVVGQQVEGRVRAGRVPAHRHARGVAAERGRGAEGPVERAAEVVQAEVCGVRSGGGWGQGQEAEEVEPVRGLDDDGADEPGVEERDGRASVGGAELEEAAVLDGLVGLRARIGERTDVEVDGPPRRRSRADGHPEVQLQAVFVHAGLAVGGELGANRRAAGEPAGH